MCHIARLTGAVGLVLGALVFGAASPAAAATPANITMSPMSPGVITANGSSLATAIVTLTDLSGNPVSGDALGLRVSTTDPGIETSTVVDDGNGTYTISVQSSTTAHRVIVTTTETATGIAASEPLTLVHGPAQAIGVQLARSVLVANGVSRTTATVTVADAHGNPIAGDALALSASDPAIRFGTVSDRGNGVYTARVFGSTTPGTYAITATDISVSPAASGTTSLTETPAPSLVSVVTMQWSFAFAPVFTVVRQLAVDGLPPGASINMTCSGRGCPFPSLKLKAGKQARCTSHPHRPCRSGSSLLLTPSLAQRRLHRGARLTVAIVRSGWIGKFYSFRMRGGAGPLIQISCLAPGSNRPGVGC